MITLGRRIAPIVVCVAPVVATCGACRADDLKAMAEGVGVSSDDKGTITVQNGAGQPLLSIGNYRFVWIPGETDGGTPSVFTNTAGERGIQVTYRVKNSAQGDVRIRGQFVPEKGKLRLRYDVWGADDLNVGGLMLDLKPAMPGSERTVARIGNWQRDAAGGIPHLAPDAAGLVYKWPTQSALVSLENANMVWQGESATHFPAQRIEAGHFVAQGQIVLAPFVASSTALAAKLAGRPLALEISTDKTYNVWDDNRSPLVVHTQSSNVSDKASPTNLKWWVRDFAGNIVTQGEKTQNIAPNSSWDQDIAVKAPAADPLLFMEVQAQSGNATVFSRTNLAILPAHRFGAPQNSLFGISAFFPVPSRTEALGLLQRIGVRWLRGSDRDNPVADELLQKYGLAQNYAQGFTPDDTKFSDDSSHTREWLKQGFEEAARAKTPYWEIGNEWNIAGGIGKTVYARQYADKVLAIADQVRHETNSPVRIMTQGLAGGDLEFIDALHDAGAWNHFDAFALHPGRGNFTPDYDGNNGTDFWTFLGTIRNVKTRLAKYGDKPLFVTESYACTQENATWHDTYRHAAENVLLSYALAQAEGVRVMDWYQLNNSVWYNPGGISDTDSEYHYGLLNFDLSPKPSLLAYRTSALALDGAHFVRWLRFPDANTKGLLFETPNGPMMMLWNRADGYVLNKNHPGNDKHFAAPEAWMDDWPTKTKITLPASASAVRELNCIGQQKTLPAKNGSVELTLDGAPRIYYGLSPQIGK